MRRAALLGNKVKARAAVELHEIAGMRRRIADARSFMEKHADAPNLGLLAQRWQEDARVTP